MIRSVLPVTAAVAALSGCATVPMLDAPPASAYTPVNTPGRVFISVNAAMDYYLERANAADAEVTREVGRDPSGTGTRLALLTTSGYEDDSVAGEQWRLVLAGTDVGLRVNDAGVRYNCRRGETPGWSRNLCP